MTNAQVSASFLQKDCMTIIRWWEKKKAVLSERFIRFSTHLNGEVDRRLNRMSSPRLLLAMWFTSCQHNDSTCKQHDKWYNSHHVRGMRMVCANDYVDNAHRLLALAERVLSENNRLKDPGIMLSSEDAEWLKNIMPQVKGKL
jgi:hypothetical protein